MAGFNPQLGQGTANISRTNNPYLHEITPIKGSYEQEKWNNNLKTRLPLSL
jgi:hypothetical protein